MQISLKSAFFLHFFSFTDRFWQFNAVLLHRISKSYTTMALFDFLFGSDERPYRSSNWTDREDWDCGEPSTDGMSGFDYYEDNDF